MVAECEKLETYSNLYLENARSKGQSVVLCWYWAPVWVVDPVCQVGMWFTYRWLIRPWG